MSSAHTCPATLPAPVQWRHGIAIRVLGTTDYEPTWCCMHTFTRARDGATPDEIWVTEHPPVFTQGQAGDPAHVLDAGAVPVIDTDRGGQVTYHGPGQLVLYVLHDLRRAGRGVRAFVSLLEASVIDTLAEVGIGAERLRGAPGVYVDGRKLAALGVRIRRGCSYHGIAINVSMDLRPYSRINPCGQRGLEVTELRALGVDWTLPEAAERFSEALAERLAKPDGR